MYGAIPDVNAYLKRIGIEELPEPTLANLSKLIFAHRCTVPFENLTVFCEKKAPELTIEKLYEKIVLNHRGGYCFELNGLFCALLEALGYEVYPVAARIGPELRPLSHRATIAAIDGKKYFCDVGFGGPSSAFAVPYEGQTPDGFFAELTKTEKEQSKATVYRNTEEGRELVMSYIDEPFEKIDFIPLNFQIAKADGSFFGMCYILNLTQPDGNISLTGNELTVRHGENAEKRTLAPEEISSVLEKYFHITYCV